ncbi:type I glyceraldehyde-3-phosphate dehydrogenase [Nitratifractor salsuginis]|uniref:Glyceraldehyde-3-phosphate dehydrogenase n=1 Tax=Nitratifractor salsuginis (strain DSM 16511 / JCM 12458 / E9I37-1) TaxID=749222 RepID=E6WZS2_NITSE|nr:type I glyceraldehyde-3-phosphate dehydrogenase [Nitratifractor salsuginis]ADV46713.1 glyceraldehyde-3-phosphate dehydrogenase [Nitratifractor salsuginis DSM 16511]
MKKVAINGLGRIGKMVLWHYVTNKPENVEIVVANGGSGTPEDLAYMLKFDSMHGRFPAEISYDDTSLTVGGQKIAIVDERDPAKLPWAEMGIDIVLECTGHFTDRDGAAKHLEAGAKKVLISAPGKNVDLTVVLGVNQDQYDPAQHHIVSNASCTTNSLAPAMKVLEERFGVEDAHITTTHAYTSSQVTIDKKKPGKHRRGRAAAVNIIPTTTGAAKATVEVLPELQGKMTAMALRVPVADGAITEIVANLKKETTVEELNAAFEEAAKGELKGILEFSTEELVSSDILGNPHSSIIDGLSTQVLNGKMVKVMAWYDNEFGYSGRLLELADLVASKM